MPPIFYRAPKLFGAFLLFFILCTISKSQELPEKMVLNQNPASLYDSDMLTKDFHAGRRSALRKLMGDSSVAIFLSATVKNRANDVNYEFHQDPNFFYLSGLNEPEAVLFVFKNEVVVGGVLTNEVLFLRERDTLRERWTGKVQGVERAMEKLGIQKSLPMSALAGFKIDSTSIRNIYMPNEKKDQLGDEQVLLLKKLSTNAVHTDEYSIKEFTAKLREIKTKEELILIRKAIKLTCDGLSEAMKALEPGMGEYDICLLYTSDAADE